ncbi:MAG: restriction endonuclease [Xanthomonadaceae bacterium]|nr:restriction endonuclease [Xanthomonadaceae bacterium]
MADVTKARTGLLVRTLFKILIDQPEGMRAADALKALEGAVTLTEYESGDFDSGGRRFERIVRFGTVPAVKAGWLIKHKGTWTVSDEGRAAFETTRDPEAFYRRSGKLYSAWRKAQPDRQGEVDIDADDAVENSAVITLEQAEEMAWKEIGEFLAQMPAYEFQELVAELLRAMGYHVSWVAQPGKDGGVDIVAYNDPIGSRPPRIKVQVKRNAGSSRIDVTGLRSFMAVLGDDDVGLFVALSGFTRDADNEARQSNRRITLLDTAKLVELWIAHYAKLADAARRRFPLKPVWFLAGEE